MNIGINEWYVLVVFMIIYLDFPFLSPSLILRSGKRWLKSLVNMLTSPLHRFNKLAIRLHRLLQRLLLLSQKQMNSVHVVGKHREKFVQSMDGSCVLVQ